jgi:hypothetical protein
MFTKEQKLELTKLVDEKNQLDAEYAEFQKKALLFNSKIKLLTGKESIDWSELVKMLCEESEAV